jgi:endonuclease YncB( thermonuclease family)
MAARKTSTRAGRSRSRQPRKQTKSRTPRTQSTSKTLASQLGKVIALVLVLGLVLLIERYCSVEIEPFGPDAKIVSIDGDTLRAANGDEYRIFGIDAPELNQSCQEANGKSWACGRAAKVKLTKLIQAGGVACEIRDTDRYGRNVALCSAEGVPDLGAVMVREGYAVDLGRKTGYAYADIEADARAGKRGIWRGTFERPADWRYANPRRD